MVGHWELIAVILIVLLLFGGKRIPEIFAGVGKGIRSFRKGLKSEEDDSKSDQE